MTISIIIDYREHKLKDYFDTHKFNEKNDINVSIENLSIGDIIIKRDDNLVLIIERKTIPDLYSSINDGRYREQKLRLIKNYDLKNIVYLIEDANTKFLENKFKNFTSIINGALLNCIFRDNIRVIRTRDLTDTINYILTIVKKICNNYEYFKYLVDQNQDQNQDQDHPTYLDSIKIKKSDNNTPKNCNLSMLCQIPGVSIKVANCIITKYDSIYNLILEYSRLNDISEKEKLIKDFEFDIANNKKRKIGPVLSKRIFEYLGIINKN